MAKSSAHSNGATSAQKMIPADCVSVLLMALGSTTISKTQFEMMSALDGQRTASSFEHQFRSITAKAKELKARVDNEETFEPVQPAKKRTDTASPATPKKRKTADDKDTPSKKPKATPKACTKKVPVQDMNDFGDEALPEDADDFIKQEADWAAQEFA